MTLATEYLEPLSLFKMEPEESLEKINKTVKTLNKYLKTYEYHRLNIMSYFKNGMPAKEWDFPPQFVFAKMDKYMERLTMIAVRLLLE